MAKSYRKLAALTEQEIKAFWLRVCTDPGQGPDGECWEWQACHNVSGYGVISLAHGTNLYTHRLAYHLVYGDLDAKSVIRHSCDNPPCCNPEHLSQGTHWDNHQDKKLRGRQPTGSRNGSRTHPESRPRDSQCVNLKVPDSEVPTIRAEHAAGKSYAKIAERYRCSKHLIYRIVKRLAHKHIP